MSVRWRPSCRTHIRSLFSKSCNARSDVFLRQSCDFLTNGKFQTDPVVLSFPTHRSIVFPSGIAPRRSTLNFRRKIRWAVTTKSLFLKKLLDGKHAMLLCSNGPWLHKLHCLSCPPVQAQRHQPHPCRVLATWKTCVSSAPPCIIYLHA
jgi:hypothetical protein